MSKKEILGFGGSIILFFGAFSPIISIPLAGSLSYFSDISHTEGIGILVVILAIISFLLSVKKQYKWLWATGLANFLLLFLTIAYLKMHGAGNISRFLFVQASQIQWGVAVLMIGTGMLVAAAVIKEAEGSQSQLST